MFTRPGRSWGVNCWAPAGMRIQGWERGPGDHLINKKKHICRDQKTIGIKKKPKRISMRVGVKEIFQGVGEWIGGGGNDSGAHVGG